jgi:hypothetical protein
VRASTAKVLLGVQAMRPRVKGFFMGLRLGLVELALLHGGETGKFGGGRKCSHQAFNTFCPSGGFKLQVQKAQRDAA